MQQQGLSLTKASMVISIPESPAANSKDQHQEETGHYF